MDRNPEHQGLFVCVWKNMNCEEQFFITGNTQFPISKKSMNFFNIMEQFMEQLQNK